MSKQNKMTLVPKLRFPEFCLTGEWKICTLSNLASRVAIRNQDRLINRVLTNSAVDGVVDQSDYFDKKIANPNNLENYFVIDEGDFVYNPRISATAPVGPISKNKVGKGIMSPLYTVFRFEHYNSEFYDQYFKTNLWHQYLKSVSNTGARHDRISISNDDFMKMPLPYHLDEEQQKIADCLSSIDKLITAEDKKLSLLKEHKKGLMQKLFPTEGKTVPEWRFPEFVNKEHWTPNYLGRISMIARGGSPRPIYDFLTSEDSGLNWLKIGDVDKEDKYIIKTSDRVVKEALSKTREVSPGDLIMSNSMSFGRPYILKIKTCIHDGWIAVTDIKNFIIVDYLYYFILSNESQKYFLNAAAGGGIKNLNAEIIKRLPVAFPKKEEQQKIADCLAVLDELITAQADKIEVLKLHKKGLMQGLFPSIKEVDE